MITNKIITLTVVSVLVALSADLAWAQQKIEEIGTDIVVRNYQSFDLGKEHKVIIIDEKGSTITDDPSHPLNMTAADCTGMVEEFPGGKYKGNGYCTNTDKDGDKIIFLWNVSSDIPGSRYEIAGGTGKFEGAKGGGAAEIIEVIPGPQGRQIAKWKGTAEYPNLRK